jgi:short-subunit dehydrogenase
MVSQGRGHIINIGSRAGRQGEPGMAAYSAAKAGLVALTQALAGEVTGSGVAVCCLCPGPVATERVRRANPDADHSAWLSPEDVAQAVLSLANDYHDSVNGAIVDLF